MIPLIQILLFLFILFALSRSVLRFREGKIRRLEFVFWVLLWVTSGIAILAPETVGYFSLFFGIGRPVDLIMYVAIVVVFYLNFRLYIAHDATQQEISKLVREIAIEKARKK